MPEELELHHPWLVAVWPGMGHVGINAGFYLMAKLGMTAVAEYEAGELFDVDHVEVRKGVIKPTTRPRNRFFVWRDPNGRHDLVVFLGEAQPPVGKYQFCNHLIGYAKGLGVERVFTFAAMATPMRPNHQSRVFTAATDADTLKEMESHELELVEDGHIGGLNGVLLGSAMEAGLPGACLLGEMPHVLARLPFPKASLAVLEVFKEVAGIDLDLDELSEQAKAVDEQLGELLGQVEDSFDPPSADEEGEEFQATDSVAEDEGLSEPDRERLDELFGQATKDRAKAFELKRELDRLGAFKEYEDRFLDLFRKST